MSEKNADGAAQDEGSRGWLDEHELPQGPIDLQGAIGCAPPVDLDIGFGKGRSLLEWSARGFGGTLLGVEIRRTFVEHAVVRLTKAGVRDVRVVRGDFRALVGRLRPAGIVRRCYSHFPDPWWKKKHQKRQVISDSVVGDLVRLLGPGGEIFVQTDVPERAEEFERVLGASGLTVVRKEGATGEANPYGVRSNREIRCAEAGLPVYRVAGRKP